MSYGHYYLIGIVLTVFLAIVINSVFGDNPPAPKPKQDLKKEYALYYFTATWCGPCSSFKPVFKNESFIEKLKENNITLHEIDIDKYSEFSSEWRVGSVPTLILAEVVDGQGVEIRRASGARPLGSVMEFINVE